MIKTPKTYPIETSAGKLIGEFRLWLKDWRVFMTTIPKNKNERIYWFLITTTWIAAWTSLILTIIFSARG